MFYQLYEMNLAALQPARAVADAVRIHPIVVVGMAQNPVVKKARKILADSGHQYKYLEYGSYFSAWKQRLAVKLWSGWPTFPQIFVSGMLVGGCSDMQAAMADGSFAKLLAR